MSYLQEVLDKIEADAARQSTMAMAGAAAIDAAYALRDRLIKEEEFEPIVTLHYDADTLQITIQAPAGQDDMFRVALAGLDIETSESAGRQRIADGVVVVLADMAKWYPFKEAA